MRARSICIMCALLGCGPTSARITRVTTIAPLELSDIKSVELFLIEGHTISGDALSCADLGDDSPLTRDDLIARDHRLTPLQDVVIPDIVETSNLILIADGYATDTGSGNRIAHGCVDSIAVTARQDTPIMLELYDVSASDFVESSRLDPARE